MTVESVKTAMDVKGCTLFLVDRMTDELKIAGSFGLSRNYLDKGPISSLKSIAESIKEGPVAIYDVGDDPRLQYPEEAKKEGIASILSVPITVHERIIGALRVYTAEPWEFTLEDVNFVHAVAQIAGMAIARRATPSKRYSKNSGIVKRPALRKRGRNQNATMISTTAAIHS